MIVIIDATSNSSTITKGLKYAKKHGVKEVIIATPPNTDGASDYDALYHADVQLKVADFAVVAPLISTKVLNVPSVDFIAGQHWPKPLFGSTLQRNLGPYTNGIPFVGDVLTKVHAKELVIFTNNQSPLALSNNVTPSTEETSTTTTKTKYPQVIGEYGTIITMHLGPKPKQRALNTEARADPSGGPPPGLAGLMNSLSTMISNIPPPGERTGGSS